MNPGLTLWMILNILAMDAFNGWMMIHMYRMVRMMLNMVNGYDNWMMTYFFSSIVRSYGNGMDISGFMKKISKGLS